MASGQTSNYGLNQWVEKDRVLREEFNSDNAKLETALTQLSSSVLQTAVGSYVGNGQHGESAPNRIEFPFAPKIVIVVADVKDTLKMGTVLISGQRNNAGIGAAYSSSSCLYLTVSWEDTGLSWYSISASTQLNETGITYFYFALG